MDLPSNTPITLGDIVGVQLLVAYLRDPSRKRPVVVLTVAKGQRAPYVDVTQLATQAAGRADIVVMPGDGLTRAFSNAVGPEAGAYRGACRVYPAGRTWESDPRSVPLRMTRDDDEIKRLPDLVADDLKNALAAPPPRTTSPTPATTKAAATPASAPAGTPPALPHPSPDAPAPPALITTAEASDALAAYLVSARRTRPVVVVSRSTAATSAYIDVGRLRDDLTGLADVCEIANPAASWAFSRAVPPMCQVYGGAGRAYPVGRGWIDNPHSSPLRFAFGMADRADTTRRLVADAMRMSNRGEYTTAARVEVTHPVSGVVIGTAGDRGLVQLSSGDSATLWPELTEPGLPAERLFAKGMEVQGNLDPATRRIDVRGMRQDAATAVAAYRPDDTILVRVAEVSQDACSVELFPGLLVQIFGQDATDDIEPDLREVMTPDETLPALLVARDGDEWMLSLVEADDAEAARPAPAVLTGGPSWLTPPQPKPAPPAPSSPGTPEPDTGDTEFADDNDYTRGLRLENQQLAGMLAGAEARVSELEAQLEGSRTQRRESMRRRRWADRQASQELQDQRDKELFLDEREQFNFEVNLAWARMIPAADKEANPLRPWHYSDHFFDTLHEVQGVSRDKIVEVVVHVLIGRAADLTSRGLHQLRTGPGGDDPVRTRAGGETCWRVYLQTNTPSARRLHYWKCKDGSIELSSIRQHDNMEA